jgi:Fic family protein
MAAAAAKFANCQIRPPVDFRAKVPFRTSVGAPLDFAQRALDISTLDRELDRAVLSPGDHRMLLIESVSGYPGPGRTFERVRSASPRRADPELSEMGRVRRQFLLNTLRLSGEPARLRPPWTVGTVQELHQSLHLGLGHAIPAGTFRTEPHVAIQPGGAQLFRSCPPDRIGFELSALLDWIDQYGTTLSPLIPATILLQGLYAIRPFPYGNMALARFLGPLYLRSMGLPNIELVPLSAAIASDPALLRRLLIWSETTGSYSELVDHITDRTLFAYSAAAARWLDPSERREQLGEVDLRIVVRARRLAGWFSAQMAAGWVGGRGDQTVIRHLNELVGSGILESLGKTRAKRYRWVAPARSVPDLLRELGKGVSSGKDGGTTPTTRRGESGTPSAPARIPTHG